MTSLRRRTLFGLGWSAASQIAGQVLQLGLFVILTRLLSAREFGLMGMIYVFTGFAQYLADMSLGASLVQKQDIGERHLNSVFWVNMGVGASLTALFAMAAPMVARFYEEPLLRPLTMVVALNFFLASFITVPKALLDRELNFRRLFWVEIFALSTSGAVAVSLVFAGAGVWSLVGQTVTLTAMRSATMWRLSSWRPKRAFDFAALKELAHFSGHLFGSRILWYWGRTLDKLIVGRVFGSAALGIYNFSFRLMQLPLNQVNEITESVMFPALSQVQDVETIKRIYLRATRMISLLSFPTMIGLLVTAEPAILAVFGDKWQDAVIILQILTVAGAVSPIGNSTGWLFEARGKTDIQFRLSVYAFVMRIAGIAVGLRWGIVGLAWAYVVSTSVFVWFPAWIISWRLINLRLTEMLRNIAGQIYCAVTMGAVMWLADRWILNDEGPWTRLVVAVAIGVAVYMFLIRWFRLKAVEECVEAILEVGGNRFRFVKWLVPT